MPSGHLLLVAPDADLRESLAFVLDAEGFSVTARKALPARSWLAATGSAAPSSTRRRSRARTTRPSPSASRTHPVVLMAEHPHPWLAEWVVKSVQLPLRGHEMAAAVAEAMHIEA